MAEQTKTRRCQSIQSDGIKITPIQVLTESPTYVFEVVIEWSGGVWCETFGSREALEAFFRGVRAGAARFGERLDPPYIPPEGHFREAE